MIDEYDDWFESEHDSDELELDSDVDETVQDNYNEKYSDEI